MKKSYLIYFLVLYCFQSMAQSTVANNTSGGSSFLGWNNTVSSALDINHKGAYPIIFSTNNVERMRLLGSGNEGYLGLGITTPQSLFHLNEASTGSVFQQFTNSTTGSASSDGLRLGINATSGTSEIRSLDNGRWFDIAQSDTVRMRFRDDIDYHGLNGLEYGPVNRIMVPLRRSDENEIPLCMMQLGTYGAGAIGRSWMNIGTYYGGNDDGFYAGLMERTFGTTPATQTDAVLAWGCQRGVGYNSQQADNFRIIFLEPELGIFDDEDSAGTTQGKEVFRIEPYRGNVGIGNFSVNSPIGPTTDG